MTVTQSSDRPPDDSTRSLDLRVLAWAAAAALTAIWLGPMFVKAFQPATSDSYGDFVQEWLSARNYWAADPIYLPQREGILRRTGADIPRFDEVLPWNGHPPVAVLVALPFGLIANYQTAHLIWNLATFTLFVCGLVIILRELRVPLHSWSVFPAIVFLVANNPVLDHLFWGQINFPILFLLALAWAAARRRFRAAAGMAVGLATAIKLFPGLVLVYFLASRDWRAAAFTIMTFLLSNAAAVGVFGVDAMATYIRDVIPSLDLFRGSWGNASVSGYWWRVFAAIGEPRVGQVCGVACQLAIVGAVAWAAWRATTPGDLDRAFCLAVAGMPLASPITWSHHYVILALPGLLLWQRLTLTWSRCVLFGAVLMLLPPEGWYPAMYKAIAPGPADTTPLLAHLPAPRDLGLCLVGFGCSTFALSVIFLLLVFAPLDASQPESKGGQ